MRKSWEHEKLGNVIKFVGGGTPSKSVAEYWNGNVPWASVKDFKSEILHSTQDRITELGIRKSSTNIAEKGELLLVTRMSPGVTAITDIRTAINQDVKIVRPISKISVRYLHYYFKSIKGKIDNLSSGSTVKGISIEKLNDLYIHFPNFEEQEIITDVLDKAQLLVKKRKEAIKKLDELVRFLFLEMFGDPITNSKKINKVKLDRLGVWKSGGTPPRKNSEYYQGDIPWYSSGELNNIYISRSIECVSQKAIDETSARLIEPGSLLLGMYDTAALKSSITTEECSCNQAIAFSKLDEEMVSTLFVYYVIQLGRDYYKRQQRGVRQKNLNLTMIRDIEIIVPPLNKQEHFVNLAKKIQQQKLIMQRSLVILENNLESLLQQAFKGELKVNTEIMS
ncbi:restriction endonuclease subunit S [Bacillus wiedmannii]|uniref:restriction endonuclease subunit S n=1 Tax=Bacillus wiedmannii TaxID=1890302 RepID=UPI000BFBB77C|nr:restriction endonuclease subunit S [Bacillus wiedmannii]PHG46311.1 restriction endonuclease subunit S [Bacillus wiedmannii]